VASLVGSVVKTFDAVEIAVDVTARQDIGDPGLYVGILTPDNVRVVGLDLKDFVTLPSLRAGERSTLGFVIESLPLLPGTYRLELHLKDMLTHVVERVTGSRPFEVVESPVYGGRRMNAWFGHVGVRARPLATNEPRDNSVRFPDC
jgi:hypothetical protein